MQRQELHKGMSSKEFLDYYYLKEEMVAFCKQEGLKTSGQKGDLKKRIAHYLDTGEKLDFKSEKKAKDLDVFDLDTKIELPFTFSEKKRAFFQEHLGNNFSFKVSFQKWVKANEGKTYQDAIDAYPEVIAKKTEKIDKQFEYNTYIRDFFTDNKGRSLSEAIACWKYKKSLSGHNKYEKEDLKCLEEGFCL